MGEEPGVLAQQSEGARRLAACVRPVGFSQEASLLLQRGGSHGGRRCGRVGGDGRRQPGAPGLRWLRLFRMRRPGDGRGSQGRSRPGRSDRRSRRRLPARSGRGPTVGRVRLACVRRRARAVRRIRLRRRRCKRPWRGGTRQQRRGERTLPLVTVPHARDASAERTDHHGDGRELPRERRGRAGPGRSGAHRTDPQRQRALHPCEPLGRQRTVLSPTLQQSARLGTQIAHGDPHLDRLRRRAAARSKSARAARRRE